MRYREGELIHGRGQSDKIPHIDTEDDHTMQFWEVLKSVLEP
jgi:hypothetical protein